MKLYSYLALVVLFSILSIPSSFGRAGGGSSGGGSSSSSSGSGSFWFHSRSSTRSKDDFPFLGFLLMAVVGLFIHFQFNNSEEDGIQKRDRKIYDELNELKQSMKTLSYGEIIELAQEKFFMIQEAWSNQDLASLAQLLTSSLYFKWRVKIQEQQTLGERNDLEDLKMHDMKLVDLTLSREGGLRAFCVYLEASCIDSMIDQQGRTLSFNHGHFIEYWYFENEKGAIKLARVGQKEDWERLSKKSNQGLFGP